MKMTTPVFWSRIAPITAAVLCAAASPHFASAQLATNTALAPVQATAPSAPSLNFGVAEVLKMFQGGISKDVLIGYIENNNLPFHLTADNIIYLQHVGLPQDVITSLIKRDGELQRNAAVAAQPVPSVGAPPQNMAPPPDAAPTAAAMVAPYPQPAPQVVAPPTVVYPDYSAYPYGYPYYGPDVIVTGGWGWGPRGWGWGRGGWGHGGFDHHR